MVRKVFFSTLPIIPYFFRAIITEQHSVGLTIFLDTKGHIRVLKSYLSDQQFSILRKSETAYVSWQRCLHYPLPTVLPEGNLSAGGRTRLWTRGLELGFRLDTELLCDLTET